MDGLIGCVSLIIAKEAIQARGSMFYQPRENWVITGDPVIDVGFNRRLVGANLILDSADGILCLPIALGLADRRGFGDKLSESGILE